MINYQKLWSSITKTLRILCKSSKEFIISKSNLEHWEDSVEPIIWLLFYLVLSYSISFTSITSQDQPLFVLEAAWPLPSARSTELTGLPSHLANKQSNWPKSYLENMETYWTTLAILAVLTKGNFHTAFSWSCRNGEGKAGIDMEGGEVPATSSTLPIFPASMQLHCLPFTCWEFFTEGSICGWWL